MKIDVFERHSGAFVRHSDDQQLARLLREQGQAVAWNLTALEFGHTYYTERFFYRRATHKSLLRSGAFRGE